MRRWVIPSELLLAGSGGTGGGRDQGASRRGEERGVGGGPQPGCAPLPPRMPRRRSSPTPAPEEAPQVLMREAGGSVEQLSAATRCLPDATASDVGK